MALKLVVDKIDDVEETFRGLYTEKDGKFQLGVDGLEDTTSLKNALASERRSRAQFEARAKSFEGLGKTEDEIKALIEAADKLEEDKVKKAGDFEKLRETLSSGHAKAIKAEQDKSAAMKATLEKHLIDGQAATAIAAAKGSADLLLPHVQRSARVIEENGAYAVQIVDAKGEPRLDDKTGKPMTITDLVSEMRASEIYGRAFEGSGHSGSGMRPGTTGGGTPTTAKTMLRSDFMQLSPAEQMARVKTGVQLTDA